MAETFLVADVGGTNTRVGLAHEDGLVDGATRRFRNADNPSLEVVLQQYMDEEKPGSVLGVCVGAAGPVSDGVARMTNLDWHIDRDVLRDVTKAPHVDVINDLQAQGYALDSLPEESVHVLIDGQSSPAGPRLVIGLGTGFNIVPVHSDEGRLVVPSCEAGHATLPYRAEQAELLGWLSENRDYPSIEHALAGQGLENIFQYHNGSKISAGDVMAAVEAGDATARTALTDYAALLATVVGDYALSHLPFGGIFLTGGVSRAVTPYLLDLGFAEIMKDKGRFSELASSFGVSTIQDDYAALKGCARHLHQMAA